MGEGRAPVLALWVLPQLPTPAFVEKTHMALPEHKSPTESLDIQQKTQAIVSGQRPPDDKYPYIGPDYTIPFLHIGTERQLFLDNFILDHLHDVKRVVAKPQRHEGSVLEIGGYPWERRRTLPQAALYDPEEGKYKL